ncbi:hypothetical protein LAJ19_07340 [Deinococcus taeanensis]|uniref:hypothetical protein n=1 Tax=Deinococcus taeanensis TaxID=2737050 RepID=UPI001CDBCAEA|nr:hypothetical protein [Deinococcus taeanensis]UBV41484.1 hypothetical protein LAJ19_07340 [Deinococcus taeanensis]
MGQAARRQQVPRVTWWTVPGVGALLLAPLLDVPALFGVGAALLLLAEYWPAAFLPARVRPGVGWPVVAGVIGAALSVNVLRGGADPLAFVAAVMTLLCGAGGLVASALFRTRPVPAALGFGARWKRAVTPDWPELSVTLGKQGAFLRNVSGGPLRLAGWSPAGVNAWLSVRGPSGEVLRELRAGQEALLPVTERDSGVRVWYAPARGDVTRLFRADWTPPARAEDRVLN